MALLEVKDLKVHFPIRGGFFKRQIDTVKAVDGVSLSIEQGATYGLVGESGSGKTTLGRAIIGLNDITNGSVLFEGKDISKIATKTQADFRKDIQMVFQDPFSSLNPKKRVVEIISEPLDNFDKISKADKRKRVHELLNIVGLTRTSIDKYPHEFSGGQLQRIGVARALALRPKLIIADEPVSALDVSIQAQVLNFLKKIQKDLNLTYLFISHDLGVVKHMCDHMGVLHRGRFVEQGTADDVFNNPQHIYTRRLISAIPDMNPRNREKQYQVRQDVRNTFDEKYHEYYDEEGLARDLIPITSTHSAALKPEGGGN